MWIAYFAREAWSRRNESDGDLVVCEHGLVFQLFSRGPVRSESDGDLLIRERGLVF